MRAILVSVNYSEILSITLPYNRHHFEAVTVVTSTADEPNVRPIAEANGAAVFVTDLFYADNASFAKWRALEAGLDAIGRCGWLTIMDADVLWPKKADLSSLRPGQLCSPLRRMWANWPHNPLPIRYSDVWLGGHRAPGEECWRELPLHNNVNEHAGYSQIFHADDPALGPPPWHQTDWKHAGGADSFFQAKWRPEDKVRPPWECLHLGECGANWHGVGEEGRRRTAAIWPARRANRAAGRDPFHGERLP